MRRVNGWLTIFWLAMIPVSILTHWISSVTYVAALSLWALVSGHWSAWQAARVEVNQQQEEAKRVGLAWINRDEVSHIVDAFYDHLLRAFEPWLTEKAACSPPAPRRWRRWRQRSGPLSPS